MTTQNILANLSEDQIIEVFDKFRNDLTCIAADDILKKWGHSESDIRKLKIDTARRELARMDREWSILTYIQNL